MADGLRQAGHVVHGCVRSAEVADQLRQAWGSPHSIAVVDVTDETAVAQWAAGLIAQVGPPDLLINNAALMNRSAVFWEVPADEFNALVDVNIKGLANVLRHFLPAMIARRSGIVVNFSSGWGRSTSPEVVPYCATKWAVEGLTQALSKELPRGVAAVALNPGIIDTDMLRTAFGNDAASYPTPEKWAARAVPLLLSLTAKHNGHALSVYDDE